MERNSLNSFENLCKIFEMRIKLDKEKNVETSIDVLDNYEKYSKKIDSIYNNEFQKELKPLISPAVTLEKEKDRLRRLIKLLEERLGRRADLEDRYYETTGKYISGLQRIISEEELKDKKVRLSIINRYLENNEDIENVTESIDKLKKSLSDEELKCYEYEEKNKIIEDELYSSFMSVINKDEYFKNISEDDISDELEKIRNSVIETKETLDITKDSIGSLVNTGMDDDYTSYVVEAERNYYNYKNKEILLKLYRLVIRFENDFKLICSKREEITELLNEKKEISEDLFIDVNNELLPFEETVILHNKILENEREILDNINNYVSRINFKEERLEELKEANNSVEILTILREYGLIDTYDNDDISVEDEVIEEEVMNEESVLEVPSLDSVLPSDIEEETVIEEVYDPYRIVQIIDSPITLNVGLAKLKGESVREKVNKKLNPKNEEISFDDIEVNKDNNEVNNDIEIVAPVIEDVFEEIQAKEEEKTDEIILPKTDFEENKTEEMPVWELPTDIVPKSINSDNNEISQLPVWEAIEPKFEEPKVEEVKEIEKVDITSKSEMDNNMFWMPVSESKLESNSFPNLNLPINNNINKNSEFVFPNINN